MKKTHKILAGRAVAMALFMAGGASASAQNIVFSPTLIDQYQFIQAQTSGPGFAMGRTISWGEVNHGTISYSAPAGGLGISFTNSSGTAMQEAVGMATSTHGGSSSIVVYSGQKVWF